MENKFKVGDLVFIRTTGEQVPVLGFYDGGEVKVRRATQTREHGIVHDVEGFEPFELETLAEKNESDIARQMNEFKQMNRVNEIVQAATQTDAKPALAN